MPASASACPRRVLLKPFLRLMGVSRTSATTSIRLPRSEVTNESMSRPFVPSGPEARSGFGLPEQHGRSSCRGDRQPHESTHSVTVAVDLPCTSAHASHQGG
jgi:hypothetical protein